MTIYRAHIFRTANYLTSTGMQRADTFRAAWIMAKRSGVSSIKRYLYRQAAASNEADGLSAGADYSFPCQGRGQHFRPVRCRCGRPGTGQGRATVGFLPSLTAAKLAR